MPPSADELLALRSRGEIRRWGAWLDGEGRGLRSIVVAEARRRGAAVPEGWEELPGKRLLRACLARDAQVRTTPIQRDEGFVCAHCGLDVPPGGRRPRDHCPRCLHGRHVDVVPGDRAAGCGGDLVPVAVESSRKGWMLRYRCASCGMERANRVLDDLVPPDDPAAVRAIMVRGPNPH